MSKVDVLMVVLTYEKPSSIGGWFVARMIQLYQRLKGYPYPAWRWTHAMVGLGKMLSNAEIRAAGRLGRITQHDQALLMRREPWLLSVTTPNVKFVRAEAIKATEWCVMRFEVGGIPYQPSLEDQDEAQRVAFALLGLPYDRPQLLGLFINGMLHVDERDYKRRLDFGRALTVCSGGVATVFEAVRRKREDDGLPSWLRLFNGKHVERCCPADFGERKRSPERECSTSSLEAQEGSFRTIYSSADTPGRLWRVESQQP
jgi:hypothetical protein